MKIDADENNHEMQLMLEGFEVEAEVSKQDIVNQVIPIINEYLKVEIKSFNEIKKKRIEEYVFSKAPRYRSLLKHYSECTNNLPLINDDAKLDLELFKQEQQYKLSLKIEQQVVLSNDTNPIDNSN